MYYIYETVQVKNNLAHISNQWFWLNLPIYQYEINLNWCTYDDNMKRTDYMKDLKIVVKIFEACYQSCS